MNNSIFIFRRDFRIKDNTALNYCIENSKNIYPIFIFTPEQVIDNTFKSDNAVQFMCESLKSLKKKVKNLIYCKGNYIDVITDIVKKNNINSIYTNTDYTKYSIKREKDIQKLCNKLNIIFNYYHDIILYEPGTKLTISGSYYQKFTPFYNLCLKDNPKKPTTKNSDNIFKKCKTKYAIKNISKFYNYNNNLHVNGGRKEALKILKNIKNFKTYEDTRNTLSIETTNLSAYLKFGCISIRECYDKFKKNFGKKHPLIRQLIWREFYYHLGYGFINRFGYSLKPHYDKINWNNNRTLFNKWKEGRTGYPVIDACMTQLNETGYMHNRGRLLVSSFLIKNLGIDWRWGEKYFAQSLVDYDVLVNNGNWQWTSGSGADSQPYFRVFNPWLQSERYDKDCEYIKYWLPNLENINSKHLHNWEKYHTEYNLKDIDYIKPIIDYKESKKKILNLYKKALK
jgi:deoxyribodipyrimidine photo-lyase